MARQPETPAGQAKAPAEHQVKEQAEQRIVACLKAKLGRQRMDAIRDTMMRQQAVWKEQVGAMYD